MNPAACGNTAVTFNTTAVAPPGTTTAYPDAVGTVPVTCTLRPVGDTNGPDNPTPVRVSSTRTGVIDTNDDGALDAAFTAIMPPPPIVIVTAAPIAAHRDLHKPRRSAMVPPRMCDGHPQSAARRIIVNLRTRRVHTHLRLRQSATSPLRTDHPGGVTPSGQAAGVDDDNPSPEELEQLARSLAMSGSFGERNRQVVAEALRRLAEIERAGRQDPSGRNGGHKTSPRSG